MSEGRKSQVVLLDERRLDIIIQPKLHTNELLDLVSSHFKLKEKQYFGLGFLDETNHFNWLQGEKRVLEHAFPKKAGLLILYFAIKFYVDTIGLLRDVQTVELFYLNARQLLYRGEVQCDAETVFELAAHVLQASSGDYVSDEKTKEQLKKLPVIPTYILKQHPSIAYCEERIISCYEKLSGTSRGLAIVNYMTIIERLETYGIHYYDVKDKKDIPWWLGISVKGIAVYDKADKTTPRKLFNWKSLENLYHKDKKFSIEVISHRKVSATCRTSGDSSIDVHTWFASNQQLTKCIWSMAVAQHQFYLDSKQSLAHLPAARSMSEIAADLSRSITSLPGSLGSDLSRSTSSPSLLSLSNSRYDLTIEQSDSLKAERDMYEALKARREALGECLRKKTEELKVLCLQEGELTGRLPKDIPLSPGEQPPVFRRRVGTAFSLSVKNLQDTDQLSNELSKLELEVQLQDQIVAAACRLASDKTVSKYVRKQRKQSYAKAVGKLKDMRKKLEDMLTTLGKYPSTDQHRSLDGMYRVVHPCSKRDHITLVHDQSAHHRDDSCGNSINSGEFSLDSDITCSKGASSGYYSSSGSLISSRLNRNQLCDDVSSYYGSMSLSTVKSSADNLSSDINSLDLEDTSTKAKTMTLDDDQTLTLTRTRRRKHFIIARGHESRVQELDNGVDISKSSVSIKSEQRTNSHLATSENDLDLDSTLDDSFTENDIFDVCEDGLREEEETVGTRVERRKLTFIASRHLMKVLQSDVKHVGFERGWKAFQHILMGEDVVQKHKEAHKEHTYISSPELEDVNQKQRKSNEPLSLKEAELQQKIQELINSQDIETPLVRSRSFDYSRDFRINGERKVNITRSKDDLKLAKTQSKSKNSTTHLKNPFSFFTQRHSKPKEVRHSSGETQASALYGCATAVCASHSDIPTTKPSSVQPSMRRNHAEDSKKNKHPSRDSNKMDKSISSSDVRNKSSVSSNVAQSHITSREHHSRSTSAAALLSSKGNTHTEDRFVDKISTNKDNHKQQQGSASASSSKDLTGRGGDHVSQHHPRRRLSWHSNSRSCSVASRSTETTV